MSTIERDCLEGIAELMAINIPGFYRTVHWWMMGNGFPPSGYDYRNDIVWC